MSSSSFSINSVGPESVVAAASAPVAPQSQPSKLGLGWGRTFLNFVRGLDEDVLQTAVQTGDLATVEKCINAGIPLSRMDQTGETLVTICLKKRKELNFTIFRNVKETNLEILKRLIAAKANLQGRDTVHMAFDDPQLLLDLIQKGADVKTPEGDKTIFWKAIKEQLSFFRNREVNYVPVIHALEERNAPLGASQEEIDEAFCSAIYENMPGIMELLLKHKADPDKLDRLQRSPLYAAVDFNHSEVVKLLASIKEVNLEFEQPSVNETSLRLAAKRGDLESVQALVAARADINAKNKYGSTALTLAVNYNHDEVVNFLTLEEKRKKEEASPASVEEPYEPDIF